MKNADEFLESIRLRESNDIGAISILGSAILKTSDFTKYRKVKIDVSGKEFKPSFYLLFFYIVYLLFLAFFVHILPSSNLHISKIILYSLLVLVITISIFYKIFYFIKFNYKICIDKKGISIDDIFYEWDSISDTAILRFGSSKITAFSYLIIITKNSLYDKYYISNFKTWSLNNFSIILSHYIEYFRHVE